MWITIFLQLDLNGQNSCKPIIVYHACGIICSLFHRLLKKCKKQIFSFSDARKWHPSCLACSIISHIKYEIMKKLLIVSGIILSFSAANLFANGAFNNGQAQGLSSTNDTTPKKKGDTTRKKDTASFAYNTVVNDTTPKKGDTTSRKKDSIAFAYNTVSLDTVHKKDTTRKKTDSIAFAINERK
jgi:hypothetical protein